jgi:ubiquinone biosynthesis protein
VEHAVPGTRLLRILFEVLRFALSRAARKLHLGRSPTPASEQLCLSLARLGTTFIKFGQALSLRRDLLPDDYVGALQSLQDHIAPFPPEVAMREIKRSLGRPIAELFAEFDPKPLAAASVAQVHAARLNDGRNVIVKVRRPEIKVQIEGDMRALTWVARMATSVMPRLGHYRLLAIIDEIWTNLRKEIDFRREAQNIRRFASAFADWPAIYIPGVIDGLVTETIIVQERSGGRRIDDPGLRPEGPRLAQIFVDAYLQQIFVLGIFHGDPHPGNLFVTDDGRICFHDFGLIGVLDRATRRKLAAFTNAFIHQDADWLLDTAIDLGVLGGEMNRSQFRRGLADIIADYAAMPLKDWSLAEAFLRVTRLGHGQNVLIPHDLLVLMRAMFLAESTVAVLDPDFQLLESLKAKGPEVLKAVMEQSDWSGSFDRLKHDAAAAMEDFPAVLGSWTRRLHQEGEGLGLSLRVRELHELKEHMTRSSNRLALALVTLGLYIAGSLLMLHSVGPRIYGEMPSFAAVAFALALWFTLRLARAITRSGGL